MMLTPTSAKTAIQSAVSPTLASASNGNLDRKREHDILACDFQDPLREPDGQRKLQGVVVHQYDIRGFHGGVAAECAHRHADVRARQHRRVVDSVADEHQAPCLRSDNSVSTCFTLSAGSSFAYV